MSGSSAQNIDTSRLDVRIDEDYDFTNGDAVLETVLDVITCPIQREIRENMIIFNDQCYDRSDFESYRI